MTHGNWTTSTRVRVAKESRAKEAPQERGEVKARARRETKAKGKVKERKVKARDFRECATSAGTWAIPLVNVWRRAHFKECAAPVAIGAPRLRIARREECTMWKRRIRKSQVEAVMSTPCTLED